MPETLECPLCRRTGLKSFVRSWKEYRLFDCPDCGIGFCLPFKNPGPEFYAQFEDLYPHQAQETTDAMTEEYDTCLNALGAGDGRRLLDVGCGGGGFLNRAKKRGFDVSGVDFDAGRLDLVRTQLGIQDVHVGSIEDYTKTHPAARFDVVTMFEVLEHLDEPARWLGHARDLLKPGGRLFIGVPNRHRTFDPFQGPGMDQLDNPPNHLTRWDAPSLRRFIEERSLEVVEIRPLGVPRPLLALLLRNRLRFGLATKALQVDELQHAPSGAKSGAVRGLVGVKEIAINALSFALYPLFWAAHRAFGWQGVVLYCAARRA